MSATSSGFLRKSLETPEHLVDTPLRKLASVTLGDTTVLRATLQPGWHWAEHVGPLVGATSCQVPHLHYIVAGRLRVRLDDGSEQVFEPGDACVIPAGHDAWVLGDEQLVMVDFTRPS